MPRLAGLSINELKRETEKENAKIRRPASKVVVSEILTGVAQAGRGYSSSVCLRDDRSKAYLGHQWCTSCRTTVSSRQRSDGTEKEMTVCTLHFRPLLTVHNY